MLITALLAMAFAGQDVGPLPPATPTYSLEGPVDFCAEEFSARLTQGETMEWIAPGRNFVRYTVRSGEIAAIVGRGPDYAPPRAAMTPLRLPLSPVARRYVVDVVDRTEMDTAGNQRDGHDYMIAWFLHGAAWSETPLAVLTRWGDRRLELPFVSRIDPRPLSARRCTISRSDPALARRIRLRPGR